MAPAWRQGLFAYPAVFRRFSLSDSDTFHGGLAVPDFCGEDHACYLVFGKNSSSGECWYVILIWLFSKHPADVSFKKSSGHVRHIKCPHDLKTFLKKCFRTFLKTAKCENYKIPSVRLKQFVKTPNAVISPQKSGTEPSGKCWMSWKRKDCGKQKKSGVQNQGVL